MPFQRVAYKACENIIENKARFSVSSNKNIKKQLRLHKIPLDDCLTKKTYIIFQELNCGVFDQVLELIQGIKYPKVYTIECSYKDLVKNPFLSTMVENDITFIAINNKKNAHVEAIKFHFKNNALRMLIDKKLIYLFKGKFKNLKIYEPNAMITTTLKDFQIYMMAEDTPEIERLLGFEWLLIIKDTGI
ncbi:hypothetical protein HZS_3157 [Henneguya salminicola]|nr:hypothetical protein HZS_3157 [Henneguya salminicola]